MTSNSIGIYATLATALLAFLTAFIGFLASRKNGTKINEVHLLVNSQLSNVVDRVDQLKGVLAGYNIAIPPAVGNVADHPVGENSDPMLITNADRDRAAKAGAATIERSKEI